VSSRRAIAAASFLYYLSGVGGGLANLAVLAYWLRKHRLPVVLGIELNSGGPFSPPDRYTVFACLFIASLGADVIAARLLQKHRRRGGVVGLALAPVGFAFGVGFELPFWLALSPLTALLIAAGWRDLRD
jgi:hypothetical protein